MPLDRILNAQSVAVVGASKVETKRGFQTIRTLIEEKYAGKIYPVNPKEKSILGLKCYGSVAEIDGPIDLALVAKLTDQPLNEVYRLNPGFNRWATSPKGPHRVLVPIDKAEEFRQQLAELDPGDRVHWIRHRIRGGETLGDISQHYHTTISVIRQINGLHGNMIRAGHFFINTRHR